MVHLTRLRFWMRVGQAAVLVVAVTFSLGATDAGSRFNDLGHRMMCTCGCAQLLGECNHVGCPYSGGMRDELSAAIAAGTGDKEILASFAAKYGTTVLAAPTTQGFDLVAWIAPFAVLAAGILGTVLLVKRWTIGRTDGAGMLNPVLDPLRGDGAGMDPGARQLRERIRRETGGEGGA
jgi:cytochrome c-type biogenesis protein CcmH